MYFCSLIPSFLLTSEIFTTLTLVTWPAPRDETKARERRKSVQSFSTHIRPKWIRKRDKKWVTKYLPSLPGPQPAGERSGSWEEEWELGTNLIVEKHPPSGVTLNMSTCHENTREDRRCRFELISGEWRILLKLTLTKIWNVQFVPFFLLLFHCKKPKLYSFLSAWR